MELAKIRRRELMDAFSGMFAWATENAVGTIIIAGDLFDKPSVAASIKREALEIIGRFNGDVLYLKGNHDVKVEFPKTEFTIPKNLKMFSAKTKWQYINIDNVCIAGVCAVTQAGDAFYEELELAETTFNIAVMHGSKEIKFDRLRGRNIDFLALGDIHIPDIKAKKLDNRGTYGYAGSLIGRGFDEIGERGFFVLDIENNVMKRNFVSHAKRKYQIVPVDITDQNTHSAVEMKIRLALKDISQDDIVRIVMTGKYIPESHKDVNALSDKFAEDFFWAHVVDESRLDRTNVVQASDEVSLVSRFMQMVAGAELEDVQKDKVIELALKALTGEDVAI